MLKTTMVGLLAVGAAVTTANMGTSQDRYVLSGNPAVYALAGEVEVVRGTGSDVVVDVELRGPDADQLSVEVDEVRGRTSLRVVYPGDEVVYDRGGDSRYSSSFRVRDDGTWGNGMSRRTGRRVSVASRGDGVEAHAVLRIEVPEGRDLNVFVGVGDIEARNVDADLELDVASGEILAEQVRGYVSADTGSGDIELRDIEGSVDADTGSGDILLERVTGADVVGDSGSGDVVVRGVVADRVEFDTGSGEIEAAGVDSPDVTADTGSGDIDIELVSRVESVEVDTGSGDVTVRVPNDLGAEIEADTGSGRIQIDLPGLMTRRSERRSFAGAVGSGNGEIQIDTGSGSIRVTSGG